MNLTRRQFMMGCSAAIAGMAGGRLGNMVFAHPSAQTTTSDEILVVVFLRGGCDGLSLVVPFDDPHYVTARGDIAVGAPGSGANGALMLNPNNASGGFTGGFGLHPKASPLNELYTGGKLAIVHACGLEDDTRSHFDAMDYIERGTPGDKNMPSGWLARHIRAANTSGKLPTLAASSSAPTSLLSDSNTVAITDPNSYGINASWRYNTGGNGTMLSSLKKIYAGSGALQTAGLRTIDTLETIEVLKGSEGKLDYSPDASADYLDESFSNSLKSVAQMIKLDLGLRVATVDFGGWDTHEGQGVNGDNGYYARMVNNLSRGLHAFYNDLPNHRDRVTVVVMSEFGRRVEVNTGGGTDHGHGNVMLLLGGNVNGGKIYGTWPGLVDLDQNQDLRITTDFRTVLSEVLVRRLRDPKLGTIFPGLSKYEPLGVTGSAADDLPIDYTSALHQVYLPAVVR